MRTPADPRSTPAANGLSAAEVERCRQQTPGVAHRVHLNNAGAALMPAPVVATLVDHITRETTIGGYEAQAEAAGRLEGVYDSLAALIGADRSEIAVADSATAAWQRFFHSLRLAPGDRILTTTAEFAANHVAYLQTARTTGARVEVIPDDETGALDPAALEAMLDERVKLISITWVPTNGGLVNPAAAVGGIARAAGIPYLLDACQVIGQLPVDVTEVGCDMLTATGRKFLRGPRGTGFGYISRSFMEGVEPALLDLFGAPVTGVDGYELRDDARRFETWELNVSTRLALGAAADYALELAVERIAHRCAQLSGQLREGLAGISGIRVRDLGDEQASIITFTHHDLPAADVKTRLGALGINVSVSPPTSTPLDAASRGLPDLVRVSPHYYNNDREVTALLEAVEQLPKG